MNREYTDEELNEVIAQAESTFRNDPRFKNFVEVKKVECANADPPIPFKEPTKADFLAHMKEWKRLRDQTAPNTSNQ